jgi:hypothetical protein
LRRFAQQAELVGYARDFVGEKISSLEKDVNHCLQGQLAPFTALLYCFAVVDLFGALASGRADKNASTTQQSISYMTSFMNYTSENAEIVLNLFRHKLVHLAQPNPVIRRDGELITWRYHHDNKQYHLKKIQLPQSYTAQISSIWTISITHEFNISIMDFVREIKDSAQRISGFT